MLLQNTLIHDLLPNTDKKSCGSCEWRVLLNGQVENQY